LELFLFLADFFKGKKQIPKKLMWQQASTLIVKNVDFPFGFYSDLVKESNPQRLRKGKMIDMPGKDEVRFLTLQSQGSFRNDMNSLPLCASASAAEHQAESDEAARYMPGSAIYLGKQNRVLCRAALVSKKHPADEDCRLWVLPGFGGTPFFF